MRSIVWSEGFVGILINGRSREDTPPLQNHSKRLRVCLSRGCFGCCGKSQPIIAVDEPSKGLRIQGRLVKKPSISEDFWSTSTYEMENSTIQSQRSLSSISVSNQVLSQNIGTGSTSNHSEFVNHGKFTAFSESSFNQNTSPHLFSTFDCYLLWNQTSLQWLGSKKTENQRQVREPILKLLKLLFLSTLWLFAVSSGSSCSYCLHRF
nr:uncharacterized protein LOC109184044 isoform X1 [Ipomoea batatas]